MVEPLSRRAQLLSSSILTQAMFLGPLQWVSGSGFRKSLLTCLYALGFSSGDVCWVAAGFLRAQLPFFAVPSFVFKSAFHADLLMSFRQSHMRWWGLLHLKQLLFFCWHSLTTLAKQPMYSIGWSVPPALSDTSTPLSAKGSVSPLSCLAPESASPSSFPMVAAQAVKVWFPFSLHKGNKFPGS